MFLYHILALLMGTILDLIIGDPHGIWHPIIVIGKWINRLESLLLNTDTQDARKQRKRGFILVFLVLLPTFLIVTTIVVVSYKISFIFGIAVEAILSCYCLAGKSLIVESKKVLVEYEANGIEASRYALSMIVGRDTKDLPLDKIIRAAVETVAENSSDGCIAPLFYMIIGGPVLGLTYKAINTMDSMVGYHNDKYENFGFAAAKLDDIANFIPSRLTGLLTILASFKFLGFDRKNALRIFLRDRYNHKSPNSAQSEAAFAGALGLELGGPSYYFGKLVEKPTIGDGLHQIEAVDLYRAHRLLISMIIICQLILLIMLAFEFFI